MSPNELELMGKSLETALKEAAQVCSLPSKPQAAIAKIAEFHQRAGATECKFRNRAAPSRPM